jgi:hypothetical protein
MRPRKPTSKSAPMPPGTKRPKRKPRPPKPEPTAESSAIVRIPRRDPPASTPNQRRAAQNLMDAMGGTKPVVDVLRVAGRNLDERTKAVRLADLMMDDAHRDVSFALKLTQVGMNLVEFTDMLLNVKHATILGRLVMSGDEVAEGILSRATDQFRPHNACLASGRFLDDESGMPTDLECFGCQGTGYILESAEREWVELYLELVKLRKTNPIVDNSRKIMNNNLNVFGSGGGGDLQSGDGAPDINTIIRRADQQQLPPPSRTLTDGSERSSAPVMVGMPEDGVNENEPIEVEVLV